MSGPLGAVLAGGASSRYGEPKALVTVGGVRIVDRVIAALRHVTPDIVISANEPGLFDDLGLPIYPDEREGLGPLGGIHTTLLRAREAGRPGILAVASDMPFPSVELLARLHHLAFGSTGARDIAIPTSEGRRGVEPLFAAYGIACIAAIEEALGRGDRRMIGFHDRVEVHTIAPHEVAALCDPARAFLNVNTREDQARAEAMVREEGSDGR